MHFHWQNLNDKKDGAQGHLWRFGRAWWGKLRSEWYFFKNSKAELSIGTGAGDGGDIGGCISIPFLVTLYVHITTRHYPRTPSHFSLRMDLQGFHIGLWEKSNEWNSRDPWYRKGKTVDWADLFWGRRKHTLEELGTKEIIIPMPEGCYKATMTLERRTWKRPRWPWPLIRHCSGIDIPSGIPFAGKGENAWDCGDDGLYGTGCNSHNESDAVATVVKSVLESRRRYGNTNKVRDAGIIMAELAKE